MRDRVPRVHYVACAAHTLSIAMLLLCGGLLVSTSVQATDPAPSYRIDESKDTVYPARARRLGVTGAVNVVFRINEDGKAYDAQVESSDAEALNSGALALIKSATFVVPEGSVEMKRRYTFAFYFDLVDYDASCPEWKTPAWADYGRIICGTKGSLIRE